MSAYLSIEDLRLIMGLTFFVLGLVALVTGVIMLVAHPYRDEAKALATQSANLGQSASQSVNLPPPIQPAAQQVSSGPPLMPVQKGMGDNISGAAQSATALIDAVNSLIKTSSGNAIVIIVVGTMLELAAYWLLIANG
jgi:hypothetical protein